MNGACVFSTMDRSHHCFSLSIHQLIPFTHASIHLPVWLAVHLDTRPWRLWVNVSADSRFPSGTDNLLLWILRCHSVDSLKLCVLPCKDTIGLDESGFQMSKTKCNDSLYTKHTISVILGVSVANKPTVWLEGWWQAFSLTGWFLDSFCYSENECGRLF